VRKTEFKELTDERLQRGTFISVPNLIETIQTWTERRNADPRPSNGTAPQDKIIENGYWQLRWSSYDYVLAGPTKGQMRTFPAIWDKGGEERAKKADSSQRCLKKLVL